MYNTNTDNPLIENSFLGSKFLNPEYLFDRLAFFLSYIFTAEVLEGVYTVLSVFSIFFVGVIIYCTIRIFEIRAKQHKHLHHEIEEYAQKQALKAKEMEKEGVFKNERWKKVLNYLFSASENDWKLAIIEADLMLFDLLNQMGFKGETLGDKLKAANQGNFKTLNSAWDAHNVRNKIAHEGSSFEIPLREAKRIIALYEEIFREFGYI